MVDFFTAGLFFLFYMPLSGLQEELDYIVLFMGPAVATGRFFKTLNRIEAKMNGDE